MCKITPQDNNPADLLTMTDYPLVLIALRRMGRAFLLTVLLSLLTQPVVALTNQVALFTGFNPGTNTGMDMLNASLATAGIPGYLGRVFAYTERQEAFDWIQQTGDLATLVLIGHSWGGNSALQLAGEFLKPVGVDVDLTIQIDSISNPFTGANDVLPTNVDVGINYYQPTGIFDLHGEDNVQGATNINVEALFNDTSITHTSIDNDPRLHALIGQNILDNLNPVSADFDFDGDIDGADFLVWQRAPSVGSLSDWQTQYGVRAGSSSTPVLAVPAPSSLVLLCVATHLLLLSRRHTCFRELHE